MRVDPDLDTCELPALHPGCDDDRPWLASDLARALALANRGARHDARRRLLGLWAEVGSGRETALARCLLAHHLAGLAEDLDSELRWNLRALQAAHLTSDAQLAAWGMPIPARSLFPLLHLSLAQCYRRRGSLPSARRHLHEAHTWSAALPADSYGDRVRGRLRNLSEHLASPQER